jgi:hypothetical protein
MEVTMTQRITVIGGAYGSGKTEFAIACALQKAEDATQVGLVDLDIVNPYFRSRDITAELEEAGVEVVSSHPGLERADLPALSPRILAFLQDHRYQVVVDVGGDPAGARALGRFQPYFRKEPYDFWIVVNPFRPDTRNVAEASRLIAALEQASRLLPTGLVANINLGIETTLELWREGNEFIRELSAGMGLPLIHQMVEADFYEQNRAFFTGPEVFPVKLRMLPPWRRV